MMMSPLAASCRPQRLVRHHCQIRNVVNSWSKERRQSSSSSRIAIFTYGDPADHGNQNGYKASLHPPIHLGGSSTAIRQFSQLIPRQQNFSEGTSTATNHSPLALEHPGFTVQSVILALEKAAQFNQGQGGGGSRYNHNNKWDLEFVRLTVEQYEQCLRWLYLQKQQQNQQGASSAVDGGMDFTLETTPEMRALFLSPETTERAFRAMLRCRVPTSMLSDKVREWERYVGSLGETPLTDQLSLRMLEANGKAGNIGRVMTLLSIRLSRGYEPKFVEFVHAVTAIEAACLHLRKHRNVFLSDKDQPQIDDPTRWLDAILLNMHQRNFYLTTSMANRMLNTFASTGKSGKSTHYFYRVRRSPLDEIDEEGRDVDDNNTSTSELDQMARFRKRPVQVRLSMRPPPPYHKIPSQVRGKLVHKPGSDVKQLKLDRESDPDWSPPLTAAITFADSLAQGACGHDPIELDLVSYSILIKVCVNRGSLWRAMHILDEVMPSNGIQPDAMAYNSLLYGLARVGDAPTIKEYFNKMTSQSISPTAETVEAIVQGLLNLGDVATAITVVQDCFNQYSVLPPYTTHLKILEVALGRGLVYEARRHVYVIQQLWKWQRNDYHSEEFCRLMELTQKNPKLSKEALQRLFAYFGESLEESDFF